MSTIWIFSYLHEPYKKCALITYLLLLCSLKWTCPSIHLNKICHSLSRVTLNLYFCIYVKHPLCMLQLILWGASRIKCFKEKSSPYEISVGWYKYFWDKVTAFGDIYSLTTKVNLIHCWTSKQTVLSLEIINTILLCMCTVLSLLQQKWILWMAPWRNVYIHKNKDQSDLVCLWLAQLQTAKMYTYLFNTGTHIF